MPPLNRSLLSRAPRNFEPREVAAIEANTEDFALQEVDLTKRQLAVGARIVVTWLVDLFGAGAKQAIYEIAESAAAGVITRTAGAAVSGVTRTAEAIGFTAIFDDGFLTMAARVTVTLRDGVVKTVLNSATRSGSSESIAKFIDISGQLLAPR
ncbi:hypothetical protein SLS57_005690 [Botryosphaeria dothidea]